MAVATKLCRTGVCVTDEPHGCAPRALRRCDDAASGAVNEKGLNMQLRDHDFAAFALFWLAVFGICFVGAEIGSTNDSFSIITIATSALAAFAVAMWLHRRYLSHDD